MSKNNIVHLCLTGDEFQEIERVSHLCDLEGVDHFWDAAFSFLYLYLETPKLGDLVLFNPKSQQIIFLDAEQSFSALSEPKEPLPTANQSSDERDIIVSWDVPLAPEGRDMIEKVSRIHDIATPQECFDIGAASFVLAIDKVCEGYVLGYLKDNRLTKIAYPPLTVVAQKTEAIRQRRSQFTVVGKVSQPS